MGEKTGKKGAQGAAQNPSDPHGYGGAPQIGGFLGRGSPVWSIWEGGRPQLVGGGKGGSQILGGGDPQFGEFGEGDSWSGVFGEGETPNLWGNPKSGKTGVGGSPFLTDRTPQCPLNWGRSEPPQRELRFWDGFGVLRHFQGLLGGFFMHF